ncbi:MAG: spore gernimation protein, partial [Oscillospiraceae bacterium]|nr:spore gernimation protein [Oscillospiraceae bacterium]
MERTLSSKQLMALSFVSLLSPFLRLIPGAVTSAAGSASWVSAALSAVPISLLSTLLTALFRQFPKDTGLAEAVLKLLGRFPGSLLLSLWALWLV